MKPLIRELDNKYIEVIGHYADKILCAKMTLLAELYAIEHKDGYALFRVEDYDKLSKIDNKLEFSITDLTGTKWKYTCTSIVSVGGVPRDDYTFSINGNINGTTFTIANRIYRSTGGYFYGFGNFGVTFSASTVGGVSSGSNVSVGDEFIIEFTGGDDVTNSTLISWLEANATQIPTIVEKTITLHPTSNGTQDTNTNLYPKTKLENLVDVPSTVLGGFLHVNETTGALEWVSAGPGGGSSVMFVDWTVATGYSGNIVGYNVNDGTGKLTYIKFDTAPTSNDDYDAYVDYYGNITGLTSYSNKTKVYVWGTGGVIINGVTTSVYNSYEYVTEITLTGNDNISLIYSASGGSND